jgi:hypothetical protein
MTSTVSKEYHFIYESKSNNIRQKTIEATNMTDAYIQLTQSTEDLVRVVSHPKIVESNNIVNGRRISR